MAKQELAKFDLQEKLKEAVRQKFQELLSDKDLNKFVATEVKAYELKIKTMITKELDEMMRDDLKVKVKEFLSGKTGYTYDSGTNRQRYDLLIENAIKTAVPDIFINMLGASVSNALLQAGRL